MIQRFEVATLFDCTETGMQNHRKNHELSNEEWQFKRNQQRNFDTLIQCISMRCQPMNIYGPVTFTNDEQTYWTFSFESDKQDIFLLDDDPVGILKQDCHNVPMIIGLTESEKELFFTPYLITLGDKPNTYFQRVT